MRNIGKQLSELKCLRSAAIFDVDGTIRNSYIAWFETIKELIDDLNKLFPRNSPQQILTIIREYTDPETRFHDLPQMFGHLADRRPRSNPKHRGLLPLDKATAIELAEKHQRQYDLRLKESLFPGVPETFKTLHDNGIKLGLYTDAPKGAILHFLWLIRDLVPAEVFDLIVLRGKMGIEYGLPEEARCQEERSYKEKIMDRIIRLGDSVIKPQPNVLFELFPKQMGISREQIVYYGDSLRCDYPCTINPDKNGQDIFFVHCKTKRLPDEVIDMLESLAPPHDKGRFASIGKEDKKNTSNTDNMYVRLNNFMQINPAIPGQFESTLDLFVPSRGQARFLWLKQDYGRNL